MDRAPSGVGRRVIVTGMTGAGKSTFSKALAARTGLPVIHLDLHYWQPGWTHPSPEEWQEIQRRLLAGDDWIADGNYHETLDLRLERADTVVILDTPWWRCAARAFKRGIRRPAGAVMPPGCVDSTRQRVSDEWSSAALAYWRHRKEPAFERAVLAESGQHTTVHRLTTKQEAEALLATCGDDNAGSAAE